ncbi:probable U3 small nucleolar RNA-associated protein 11 [Nephila pilipes]|uniref:Probable U3 small nucleolar RNA-associated protein 11 n=1 Tax=Nephila pilipes TaxID=299642 RepID=A0A8X6NYR3_NEPPI|nr:probable U3 small nucleolar RNA-associated protein 11 [Nephila pilipes]
MSSWSKASKSGREHKERHQPESRKHLGLLEKKKDYKLRSRAFHVNENRLKKLLKKAKNKNPDEFHFHMINSETRDGVHYEKEKPEEHSEAQMKLMKTQDLNYINYKLSLEKKNYFDSKDLPQSLHPPSTTVFQTSSSSVLSPLTTSASDSLSILNAPTSPTMMGWTKCFERYYRTAQLTQAGKRW